MGDAALAEPMLYGLDEKGRAAFSEALAGVAQADLRAVAERHLLNWPVVEIWDGSLCVVRLRRKPALAD